MAITGPMAETAVNARGSLMASAQAIQVMGNRLFYAQGGEAVAAVLGGAIAVFSLELPAVVNAVTAWVPFVIATTLVEPPGQRREAQSHRQRFGDIFDTLFRNQHHNDRTNRNRQENHKCQGSNLSGKSCNFKQFSKKSYVKSHFCSN